MSRLPTDSGLLVGRAAEKRRIGELIRATRAGQGGSLVLHGEAGIGKSTLLAYAAEASGCRVVRASGAEFEQELPFAAFHQLCVLILGHLDELPEPHREALHVAFGLAAGRLNLFAVGLAALELIAAAGREQPLLCVVDDAQWLDTASARTMAFLARRTGADRAALIFATRSPAATGSLAGLPSLAVTGLTEDQARELLTVRHPFPLDDRIRDRMIAESGGNPLALLELPRSGGFELPPTGSVPSRIEHEFRARLDGLPGDARLLLTLAGADPTGDPHLLWPAARALGLDDARTTARAAATGLVEFEAWIRFCHPLARAAVYESADHHDRLAAHAALAEVTDPVRAPDRRAWHRAQATVGPDDELAAELQRCAARAQARGGLAAAAAFLDRSAVLSMDAGQRVERTLAAAQARHHAGDDDRAAELLSSVDPEALDESQRAVVDMLRGRIAFARPGDEAGPALMVRAARRLAAEDPARARDCLLDAVEMALSLGRTGSVIDEIIQAASAYARAAPARPDLLDALVAMAEHGPRTAAPMLRSCLRDEGGRLWSRRPALATMIAVELWDPATHAAIAEWLVTEGRRSGSPLLLRLGLAQAASDAALAGRIGRAIEVTVEESAIADATGGRPLTYHRLILAALRGRRDEALALFSGAANEATDNRSGDVGGVLWAVAMLHNGLADFPAALAAAQRAVDQEGLFLNGVVLPELIEAAVRCDEPVVAARALDSLTERIELTGSPSGAGVAAYARGMVTGVEDHFQEAIRLLTPGPLVPYRARAHLVYGEWLRRERRRADSRRELRIAYQLLSSIGADGFARRAAEELHVSGERIVHPAQWGGESLTMQEFAVARLAAAGAGSKDVATRLFISKRTVDAHMRNIFRKLNITSRKQLKAHPALDDQQ